MDFHSLARRDLQSLCKKNRVPANLTNAAMVKALEALETVEGMEEIQEALGFQSPKVKSPKLPQAGRRTSSRGAAFGDEPKIQQQPSPLPQSHGATVKTLEVTEMASKEEEIQETLGEEPLTGRRTSVSRAALGEEPKIQQQKPLHRSRRAAAKDSEVTEMASKEEEVEGKDVPTIFPKTPATKKAVKGVEAQSTRRRAKKTETTKSVEAKGGKAIGVVTRRSTRLSSRKSMEEIGTTQSKSRSSSRENAAVKMEALAKEDTVEKEKEEEKKDLVEYGDSCAVIVEEHGKKDQEAKSHELAPSIDGDDSKGLIENECEATHGDVPMIQQKQLSTRTQSRWVTTKAQEATKIDSEEEDDKKAPKLLHISRQSTRVSSKKPVEKNREDGIFKMVALTDEDGEKQEKEKEKKDLAEKSDSCVVAPVEEDAEKDQKAESHAYSSFIEMENRESIVALVEEVEVNDQEVEIHDFSSSTQGKGSNIEVEIDDSIVVFVEGDKMKDKKVESREYSSSIEVENGDSVAALVEEVEENDQEVKIHGFSSSAQRVESNIEVQNGDSTVVLVKGGEMKDQKVEINGFSSSIEMEKKESIVSLVDEVKENDQEVEIHDFSSSTQGKGSKIEVENDDSIVVFVEGDEMKHQKVESQEYSSSIEVENGDFIAALVDEVEENDQEVHGFPSSAQRVDSNIEVQNGDSTVVLVKGDEMKHQKVENQEYSSSIEVKNGDFIAALVDEVEENDQEVKIHGFPSSTQRVDSNIEVQNGDSTVVLVKGGEMKDQRVEIYGISSSIIEVENGDSIIALVEKDEENDQEGEIHGFSFSSQKEDSNIKVDEAFEFTKEAGDQPPENEHVKDSGNQSPENEYVEVSSDPSPENKAVEYCSDQSPENDLVEDSSNQGCEFVEVSDDLLPTNEAVEDSGDHSSNAGLDSLLCSEIRPLPHKEAIVCSQGSDGIEEEEGKLSLLFTEMTLREADECGDALLEPVVAQDASFVSKILPVPIAIRQDADHVATTDIVIPQDDCSLPTNEAVEDSGDHSKAVEETLQIEEEEGKLSQDDDSVVSKNLPAATVIRQDADHVATADIVIPQDDCSSPVLSPAMVSLNKIPYESETMFLIEPSIVQTQSSEEAGMAATEIEAEKEETKTKALEEEKEVFLKDENLELLSLTKLRAMYKQMLNGTKNEQERKKSIIKHDENCKQKLNDDMIKLTKSPSIKQENLGCLSRSKLDSNCKQKLNDDKIKSERKRTPLKNLNYSTF